WISSGDWSNPPAVSGPWGEVYGHYYRLKKRNRRRKQRLLTMLNQFQESAAALPDATVELGERGEIFRGNAAALRLLGFKIPQDVGVRIDNLIRNPLFADYLQQGDYREPVLFPSPIDENRVLSVQLVPYGDKQKLLVARDVTRLQQLEKVRQDFVANVSHELKTPLTVLSGFVEMMQDSQDASTQKWARSLQLMGEQTTRMKNIVEDLLLLSRLETKERRVIDHEVNVPTLLTIIRDEAQALCQPEQQLTIALDIDANLWLRGDEAELRSGMTNLVANAVHYSRPGGSVEILWREVAGQAVFTVKDNGIGIPAEEVHRITERFYRVDKSRTRQSGGTGLGLAIVKHVLARHQAELQIKST
ncbi:MAG: two-component system OmpR family phosphate regulon sensor histidine kinase PhoR, partial [Halothiobacillaceae bacterium]